MDTRSASDLAAEMEELTGLRERQINMIARFLDDSIARDDALFVEVAQMGGSPSYIASASLEWIRNQVSLANTMPLLKKSIDPETGKLRIDEESIEAISQRAIDWSREAVLAKYLIERDNHKFPPILVVLSQPWVDDPDSDMWDEDGCAKETSATFRALDGRGRVGMLELGPQTRLYAFDGQHRVIGIDAALKLITYGRLDVRDKEGKVKRDEVLLLDAIVAEHNLDEAQLQQLGAERMGVEIIPAVLKGESREDAQRRVRSIFTHVNKQASPLTPGEVAQLDEDNGFAIVARRVAVEHPLFKTAKSAVNFKNSTISKRSAHITTLQTLTEMAKGYLLADNHYSDWEAKGRELARRPSDAELVRGRSDFAQLWDYINEMPTFQAISRGESASRFRRFGHEVERGSGGGKGHLLLRPVGQQAMAQAVGLLRAEGMHLDDIFSKLHTLDSRGGLKLDAVENPWWGVLYDFNGQRMSIKGRDTAVKIFRHLVSGLPTDKERRALRDLIADARLVGEHEYRDYSGEVVQRNKISLPATI
ncbi:DGQHR domain-containing protein [Kitasatospora sp. RB6PN24]|uniref:DGQHR domain-containing protein n=1 Tax=Kitasatospora humi TaxID=2893891 RepID=UPI001E3A04CD|nr:DGQHR domain-containing protein [Kitasatospora humi]MCC9309127.1 DGQHR domain-containing protein [Kitasatospora humi]